MNVTLINPFVVGKLSNIICGDARRQLESLGHQFQGSIPAVITGKRHKITHSVPGLSAVMPFTIGNGYSFPFAACVEY
jgi:chemotaxis protein CheX